MSHIFISYRREDSSDAAGRIYDALVAQFGKESVFKDAYTIPPGVDFRTYIEQYIAQSVVVLVLIGPRWLDPQLESAQQRLFQPVDYVRTEIELAIQHHALVIPVLLQNTPPPHSDILPSSIAPLAYMNAIPVRPDPDFPLDMNRLSQAIRSYAPQLVPQFDALAVLKEAKAGHPQPTWLVQRSRWNAPIQSFFHSLYIGILFLLYLAFFFVFLTFFTFFFKIKTPTIPVAEQIAMELSTHGIRPLIISTLVILGGCSLFSAIWVAVQAPHAYFIVTDNGIVQAVGESIQSIDFATIAAINTRQFIHQTTTRNASTGAVYRSTRTKNVLELREKSGRILRWRFRVRFGSRESQSALIINAFEQYKIRHTLQNYGQPNY